VSDDLGGGNPAAAFQTRLDAVERRLRANAQALSTGLTDPDTASGERWDQGQVWAHLAEFCPYWVGQVRSVVAAPEDPAPFGRTKADPGRLAAIAGGREGTPSEALGDVVAGIAEIRSLLAELPDAAWRRSGLHSSLGVMPLTRIVDEFLVGHLEEHADQLDRLQAHRPSPSGA
jgi:hypothetical protein